MADLDPRLCRKCLRPRPTGPLLACTKCAAPPFNTPHSCAHADCAYCWRAEALAAREVILGFVDHAHSSGCGSIKWVAAGEEYLRKYDTKGSG